MALKSYLRDGVQRYSRARRTAMSSFFLCFSQRASSACNRFSSDARSVSIVLARLSWSRLAFLDRCVGLRDRLLPSLAVTSV